MLRLLHARPSALPEKEITGRRKAREQRQTRVRHDRDDTARSVVAADDALVPAVAGDATLDLDATEAQALPPLTVRCAQKQRARARKTVVGLVRIERLRSVGRMIKLVGRAGRVGRGAPDQNGKTPP